MLNFSKNQSAFFKFRDKKIACTILSVHRDGSFEAKFVSHEGHYTRDDYDKFENYHGDTFAVVDFTQLSERNFDFKCGDKKVDGKYLIEWVREILFDFGRPMHHDEIKAELLARGYKCPFVESEERTPSTCRIKTRLGEWISRGNTDIVKTDIATYQYVG